MLYCLHVALSGIYPKHRGFPMALNSTHRVHTKLVEQETRFHEKVYEKLTFNLNSSNWFSIFSFYKIENNSNTPVWLVFYLNHGFSWRQVTIVTCMNDKFFIFIKKKKRCVNLSMDATILSTIPSSYKFIFFKDYGLLKLYRDRSYNTWKIS